jgi:hypothetical protein
MTAAGLAGRLNMAKHAHSAMTEHDRSIAQTYEIYKNFVFLVRSPGSVPIGPIHPEPAPDAACWGDGTGNLTGRVLPETLPVILPGASGAAIAL